MKNFNFILAIIMIFIIQNAYSYGFKKEINQKNQKDTANFVIEEKESKTIPYHDFKTTKLSKYQKDILQKFADYLKQNPQKTIIIDCHTSGDGKDENERLTKSQKRGNEIIEFLINNGIERGRIFFNPRAATMLKYPPDDKRNNRVDITIN
jgi:outer membrane protein OmpA-like peptidoglycan-associated protein